MFPRDIANLIGQYCADHCLLPWIKMDKFRSRAALYANPEVFRAGFIDFDDPGAKRFEYTELDSSVYSSHIVQNPAAAEHIKAKYETGNYRFYPDKWANPALTDWLLDRGEIPRDVSDWACFSYNTNKRAVDLLLKEINKHKGAKWRFTWEDHLYTNPMFIDWARNMGDFNLGLFCNPAAIDMIRRCKSRINYEMLARNSHPWAIGRMRRRFKNSRFLPDNFLANPGIFGGHDAVEYADAITNSFPAARFAHVAKK